jgi:hypothetical protein
MEELLRQDRRAVDLSDGTLTRLQLFEPIDVVALTKVLRERGCEIVRD